MNPPYRYIYSPALRMKAGELAGVLDLAADVAACTLPRFIVPPHSERDPTQPMLLILQNEPDISLALARHWRGRDCFVDATYLLDECGRDRMADWLPRMFARARRAGAYPIPMALLTDLSADQLMAYRACVDPTAALKFGVVVPSGQAEGPEFRHALAAALTGLGLSYDDCGVVIDFSDADLSMPELVEPIIRGAIEDLQDLGPWRHIIFQGTNYPEKNPADHGAMVRWSRYEWTAWRRAVRFESKTADYLMFGDYAADCAKIEFGVGGGRAIRHFRYATEEEWLVVRGSKEGTDQQLMKKVCADLMSSGQFAGAGFSSADTYIARTSQGLAGPGNATTWRQINTTHHITRVVVDIGKVRGISISERTVAPASVQLSLI